MKNLIDLSYQFARLNQAKKRFKELEDSIQAWPLHNEFLAEPIVSTDRLSYQLMQTSDNPPFANWSLIFSEIIHHLRSTLDNLIMTISKSSVSGKPKQLKKIFFPICKTRDDWEKQKQWIDHIPKEYLGFIESIQPFQRDIVKEDPKDEPLLILQKLSNEDKHHLQIKSSVELEKMSIDSAIEYESDEEAAKSIPVSDSNISYSKNFQKGEAIFTYKSNGRISKVNGSCKYSIYFSVLVNDKPKEVCAISGALGEYVELILNRIANPSVLNKTS